MSLVKPLSAARSSLCLKSSSTVSFLNADAVFASKKGLEVFVPNLLRWLLKPSKSHEYFFSVSDNTVGATKKNITFSCFFLQTKWTRYNEKFPLFSSHIHNLCYCTCHDRFPLWVSCCCCCCFSVAETVVYWPIRSDKESENTIIMGRGEDNRSLRAKLKLIK